MKPAMLGVCAVSAGVLVALGCSSFSGVVQLQPSQTVFSVVGGPPQAVAQSTNNWLHEAGFRTVVTEQGKDVRIASTTPTGRRFTLVFAQYKGDATRVHIDWEGAPDWQTGAELLAQLEARSNRVIVSGLQQAQAKVAQAQSKMADVHHRVQERLGQVQQTLHQVETSVPAESPR